MKATADAIVYAAAYIDSRDQREEFDDDDSDESAVSHIMAYLSHATPVEEDALAAAAERALKEERSLHHPQQDMIEFSRVSWKSCLEWIRMATSVPTLTDRIGRVAVGAAKARRRRGVAVAEERSVNPQRI